MTRTRAQRRANDHAHQRRNRRLTTTSVCSATITPGGERCSCSLCEAEKRNVRGLWELRATRNNTVRDYDPSEELVHSPV